MFGTLKPHRCALGDKAREEHDRFYCGLCKSLGDNYGLASRALVSHDAVFLGLLVDALVDEPAKDDRCRCPLLPVIQRPTVAPGSVAMRFSAAVEMLLGEQWLADKAVEGKALARWAKPLASRYADKARIDLAELGIDVSPLDGFERIQSDVEARVGALRPIDASAAAIAAEPTARALGFLFSQIAHLNGARAETTKGATRDALEKLGRAVGQIIYFTDALDDLEKDFWNRDFNPCLVPRPSLLRVERTTEALFEALEETRRLMDRLPLARHQTVLDNILARELPRAAKAAASKAKLFVESERAMRPLGSFVERMGEKALVLFTILVAWVAGLRTAHAEGSAKRPSLPPTTTSDARVPPDSGPLASTSSGGDDAKNKESDKSTDSSKGPEGTEKDGEGKKTEGADGNSIPGSGSGSTTSGGSGSSTCCCTDICNSCSQSCNSCCKDPCNGCCKGDCCNGCCKGGGGSGCCGGGGGKCC